MINVVRNILYFVKRNKRSILCMWTVLFISLSATSAHAALLSFGHKYSYTEYLAYCNVGFYTIKYGFGSSCWSCSTIHTLMDVFTASAASLANYTHELGLLVLQYGAGIWIVLYLLKSLSAFAAQDPSKVLDGLFSFMFKWAIVYILVEMGIDALVEQIINPLLGIGMDIGTEFLK